MNGLAKLLLIITLPGSLFTGCSGIASTIPPPVQMPVQNTPTLTVIGAAPAPAPDFKLEIIYFHSPWRCDTCLCWEERITYVVNTHFADYIKDGTITYKVLDIGDYKNNDIARKYGTSSSQLFINRIVEGKDNIKYIQEMYQWGCRTNEKAFDNHVKEIIEKSLEGHV